MKKLPIVIFILLVAGCSDKSTSTNRREERHFNAGAVVISKPGEIVHTFKVVNENNQILKIKSISKSYGCANIKLDRHKLPSGQSTNLQISTSVAPSYAQKNVLCILETEGELSPSRKYSIEYTNFPRIEFRPRALDFGSVDVTGLTDSSLLLEQIVWLDILRMANEKQDKIKTMQIPEGIRDCPIRGTNEHRAA